MIAAVLERLALRLPIVQAPMAGVATPAMAAAVCEAGALGSLGLGASSARSAGEMLAEMRERTKRPYNANVFVHASPRSDGTREAAWLAALAPAFRQFSAEPPSDLRTIYRSFAEDDAMMHALVDARPAVVSFHFGLPPKERMQALRAAGCFLIANVTSIAEARTAEQAGIDAVIAQGFEAGGHRGVFDPAARDDRLTTLALTRLLATRLSVPVIAAGGIMDGAGIRAALAIGAAAAQLGTAFIGCPESSADEAYRSALASSAAERTVLTPAISGRPARCLSNAFTALAERIGVSPPEYPIAYAAGKALNDAARAAGDTGYGAHWAGQGAPLARAMPAAALVATLAGELSA